MKRFNRHSLSLRFMTPNRSCIPESTDNRPRNLCRGSLGMFLASLLYELKCLRIDLFKIDCCLHVSFIIWFLYVLNSIKNACRVFIALADRRLILCQCAFSQHFKQKVCYILYCVFWLQVRRNLQVFLSLYRTNREVSKVFVYKLFLFAKQRLICQRGYIKIHYR